MHLKGLTKKEYRTICKQLDIEPKKDEEAVYYLSQKLNDKLVAETLSLVKNKVENKPVLIFAPGSTLFEVLNETKILNKKDKKIIVAVDGAAKALLEKEIPIDIIITDLDGNIPAMLTCFKKYDTILVIHAHGDNKELLQAISDILPQKNVLGSTQTSNTLNVKNFEGFTDGDRAVYFIANFNPKNIILFAFDFGEKIGKYSKPNNYSENEEISIRKRLKFTIAKELLAKLPKRFPKIPIYNFTHREEEELPFFQRIDILELADLLSENEN